MASNDDKTKQFREVTGADDNRARFFLESAGWDMTAAAEMFFSSGGGEENLAEEGAAAIEALNTGPVQQPLLGRGRGGRQFPDYREDDDDDADDEMIGRNVGFGRGRGMIQPAAVRPTAPPAATAGGGGNRARIATLGSLRGNTDSHRGHGHDDDEGDSDDEGRQGFYAGAGQQIMGPKGSAATGGNDPSALVRNMFKAARAGGAHVVTGDDAAAPPAGRTVPGSVNFGGQGIRLGANEQEAGRLVTERPHEGVAAARGNEPRLFVLNMWRNGFSVDDGPLRAFDDPASQTFLTAVMRGEIPDELHQQAGRGNVVHVNMEDHRHEEYKAKPAPKMQPFSGAGHMLGSPAPTVISQAPPASAALTPSAPDSARYAEAARSTVKVNDAEPVTNIQIRFPDNSRLQGRFNQSHNVGDLRSFIAAARPDLAARQFALMQAFPRVELSDESKTLKDAGLVNASVAVHYK